MKFIFIALLEFVVRQTWQNSQVGFDSSFCNFKLTEQVVACELKYYRSLRTGTRKCPQSTTKFNQKHSHKIIGVLLLHLSCFHGQLYSSLLGTFDSIASNIKKIVVFPEKIWQKPCLLRRMLKLQERNVLFACYVLKKTWHNFKGFLSNLELCVCIL